MDISKLDNKIKPSGTMAISNKARELKKEGKPVIGFGAGEPDFASPDYVVNEVKIAADDPKNHKYSPVAGLESLRKEISRTTFKYSGVEINENNVVVSNGGKQAIVTALMSILDSGDEVIIPTPYWTTYHEAVKLAGGEPVFIHPDKKDNFKISVSDLEKAKNSKTKLLIWCSPSNPTGVVYSKEESEEIYNWVFENDIWILSDELYEHLVYEGKTSPSPGQYDKELTNTIIINGVSKAYAMTGWRIGYAAGPKNIIAAIRKIQSQSTSNPSSISQAAAVEALNGTQSFIKKRAKSFSDRRNFVVNYLNSIPGITCLMPKGAFYVFPSCKGLIGKKTKIKDDSDFVQKLLEKQNVAVVQGSAFGLEGYFRISYATSMKKLKIAMQRIKLFCESLG